MSIKARINIIAALITLLVAGVFFATQNWAHGQESARAESKLLDSKQVLWNKVVSGVLNRMEGEIRTLSRDRDSIKAIHKKNYAKLKETAGTTFNKLSVEGSITSLSLLSPQGEVIFSSGSSLGATTQSKLLAMAIESGKNQKGLEFSESNQLIGRLIFPLYRRAKPVAYASYEYALQGAIEEYKNVSGFDVAVLDQQGQSLYVTDEELFDGLEIALPLENGYSTGSSGLEQLIYSYEVVPGVENDGTRLGFVVTAADDTESIVQQQNTTMTSFGITMAVLVLCLATLTVFLSRAFKPISMVVHELEHVANGDLSRELPAHGRDDEAGLLLKATKKMLHEIQQIVSSVEQSSTRITQTSVDIDTANQELAKRNQEQSVGLVQTSSNIDSMSKTVKENAESASKANDLAASSLQSAQSGLLAIKDSIAAVKEIETSSSEIVDIIGVIDDIAFQTNLLALNASIEAARAGTQGKGFAVVASEVSKLAQRSGDAAAEIKVLINASVAKVKTGTHLVSGSGELLDEIVSSVEKVTYIVKDITQASSVQATGIDEISYAISIIDDSTHQNATMVEKSAITAKVLADESKQLRSQMEFFKLAS